MKSKLKISIVTQLDPIYMISFFDEFFALTDLKDLNFELEIFDMPNFNESKLKLLKRLIGFYGFRDFLRLLLIYMKEIFFNLRLKKFKYNLKKRKIKLQKINTVNGEEFLKVIQKLKPKFVISISAPEIFKDKILSVPDIKFINVHCANLPAYKGMMPNFWQKINNEIYSAITIHEISTKVDCGNIIYQKKIDLIQTDSLHETIIKGKKLGAITLLEFLFHEKINPSLLVNDNSYFSFPRKKDVIRFKRSKKRIF